MRLNEQFPGAVLSFTIDKYIYIAQKPHFDSNAIRVSYSITENVNSVGKVEHELVRQALLQAGIYNGIEIVSIADVPGKGSGLGSSSAYLIGLLKALMKIVDPEELAEMAFEIEGIRVNIDCRCFN